MVRLEPLEYEMKVAVFGASGFVGTALVEKLLERRDVETLVYIHNIGSAWRLSRANIATKSVDILSADAVAAALDGVTHVVNCTRGSSAVMLNGLENLLHASRVNKVRRFVHLSSTAVYGNPPSRATAHEDAPANPVPGSYGWEKLQQDNTVAAAAKEGLDCVVLCPPNISGVYSSFVNNVLGDIRKGTFALVDGGLRPNNTVDVDNLVHAITLAISVPKGDGKRIFVSDGDDLTWKDLADALLPLAELKAPIATVAAADVVAPLAKTPPLPPLWKSLKHLASSEVREAVRRDPRWARIDMAVRRLVAQSGAKIEDRLRHSIEGPQKVMRIDEPSPYSSRYTAMQLLGVCHRIDRARSVLGYEPKFNFAQSMTRYRAWYGALYGFGTPYWPLVRILETF
jgi:nucleoside-diphosphate-sugar epimerase